MITDKAEAIKCLWRGEQFLGEICIIKLISPELKEDSEVYSALTEAGFSNNEILGNAQGLQEIRRRSQKYRYALHLIELTGLALSADIADKILNWGKDNLRDACSPDKPYSIAEILCSPRLARLLITQWITYIDMNEGVWQ